MKVKRETYLKTAEEVKRSRREEEMREDRRAAFVGNLSKSVEATEKEAYELYLKQVIEKAIGPVRRITIACETGTGKIEFEGTQEEAEKMSTILIGAARDIFDANRRQLRFSAIRP